MKYKFLFSAIAYILVIALQGQDCRPVKCVTTYRDTYYPSKFHTKPIDTLTQLWFYDEQGRLIEDSISSSRDINILRSTEYYSYTNDTIIGVSADGSKIFFKTSKDGLPVQIVTNYFMNAGKTCSRNASYNGDGTLQKIIIEESERNEVIDSIVYSGGNIVSYTSTYSYPWIKGHEKYTCTYYTDKDYAVYNPTFKMWGLSNWETASRVNVQAYSKNLLKSISEEKGEYFSSYTYMLDKHDRITDIVRTHKQKAVPPYSKQFKIEYLCK
jgi:hypothetical protein